MEVSIFFTTTLFTLTAALRDVREPLTPIASGVVRQAGGVCGDVNGDVFEVT